LRFAAALCPRSVLTTGVGTTSAGLTCAAVREGNDREFALEAGALVLADKGVCCIDEFGCIRNEDRTTIHEAMEQQTLSVAKAGIVCKLNCRATIIAVMNPRNSIYDNFASLSANTGLGTPLLSRFDIIFKLVDSSDEERDHNVTAYLMNRAIQGIGFDSAKPNSVLPTAEDDGGPWPMEKLRAYISVVKDKFRPRIAYEAALLLESHYEMVRSAQSSVIPVTVRFLESLIRLTQSHARLCYRDKAELFDAVCVLRIMEASAYAYGGFDAPSYTDPMRMDVDYLEPDDSHAVFEYNLLKRYNMVKYMKPKRRNKAMSILEGMGFGVDGDGGPGVGGDSSGDGRNNDYDGSCNAGTNMQSQTQYDKDHYGRDYPTTNQDYPWSTQSKKRRRPYR
jgi:DNA helicase MCM9